MGIDLSGLAVLKDGATVTLGNGADSLKWDVAKAKSAVLDGGAGSDTLYLAGTQNVGQSVVDLSSTTDQVTQTNGEANSAVQKNFENVDASGLAGFGATITGSSAANVIVGSSFADVITAGAGADTITSGNGADTVALADGTTNSSDTIVFTTSETGGADRISGFTAGATAGDILKVNVVLTDKEGTEVKSTIDTTDDIASTTAFKSAATHASFDGNPGALVYAFTTDVGGTIDFSTATDAQIVTAIASGLAATSGNVLSGTATSAVTAGDTGETLLLAFTDGTNVAVLKYVEAGTLSVQEAELTLVGVLNSVTVGNLTHDNFYA